MLKRWEQWLLIVLLLIPAHFYAQTNQTIKQKFSQEVIELVGKMQKEPELVLAAAKKKISQGSFNKPLDEFALNWSVC